MGKWEGYNNAREELYDIKQDVGDEKSAGASTMNWTRTAWKHPKVRYKEFLLTTDLYKSGDELMLHLYCPRCRHALRISSKRKDIHFDEDRELLSVEPFECTWEIDDEIIGAGRAFGFSLCRWRVAIDNGIAKDA